MSHRIADLSTIPDATVQGPPSAPGLPPPPRVSPSSARNPRNVVLASAAFLSNVPMSTTSPVLADSRDADVGEEDASTPEASDSAPSTPTLEEDDPSALPSPADSPPSSRAFCRESAVQDFGRLRQPASISEARINLRIQDLSNDVGLLEAKLEAYSASSHAFMLELFGGLEKRLVRVIEDSEARAALKVEASEARLLTHVKSSKDAAMKTQVSQFRSEKRFAQWMVDLETDIGDHLSAMYTQQGELFEAWARAT